MTASKEQLPGWMLAREHISTHIFDDNEAASKYVAEEIAVLIRQRQKEGKNRHGELFSSFFSLEISLVLAIFHANSITEHLI